MKKQVDASSYTISRGTTLQLAARLLQAKPINAGHENARAYRGQHRINVMTRIFPKELQNVNIGRFAELYLAGIFIV